MRFGWMEILLILGVILLVFGPKRFGLITKSAKQGFNEFKEEAIDEKKQNNKKE